MKVISYPIISSNVYVKPGYEEVSPYLAGMQKNMIIEVNGHKIGFFSIDTPTLRGMVSPATLDAGGIVCDTDVPGVAAAMVAELQAAGAEVIIAVDHCGFTRTEGEITDPTQYNSYHVALVEGVDAVIDAHDHVYRLADKAENVNGTLVVSTGTALNFLGALKIDFTGTTPVITSEDVTEACAAAANDPATQEKLDEWQAEIDKIANEVAFVSEANFWGGNVSAWNANDQTQTTAIARRGYTNAGQLIADVMQNNAEKWVSEFGPDAGVPADTPVVTYFGGGSVRGSFPKGEVTLGQLMTAYSFSFGTDGGSNYVLVSPKTLWVLLEHGVNIFGNPDGDPQNAETGQLLANGSIHGRFPQLSGASYVYDLTKPRSTEAVTDSEGVVHVPETIGQRIQSITLDDGTVLDKNDDTSRILLVTSDYQQGGGDGYWMLGYATDWDGFYTETINEEAMGEGWYLIDYVKEVLGGVIPADMYSLTSDRIKRVNDPYTGTEFTSKITLTDAEGNPMPKGTLTVTVDGGEPEKLSADEEGHIFIEHLANGAHEVSVDNGTTSKTWYLDNYCGLVNIFYAGGPAEAEPFELTAELVSGGVKLSFTGAPKTGLYEIYRKTGNGEFEKVGESTKRSYKDTSVDVSTAYEYQVKTEGAESTLAEITTGRFLDVLPGDSWNKAVNWAVDNGIVNGTSDTTFSPKNPCTRAQMALMLYRLAGKPAVDTSTNPFSDLPSNAGIKKAIIWAYNEGIVNGSNGKFNPNGNVTRAQLAIMLWKMAGKPSVAGIECPFEDLEGLSSNNVKAITWAYDKGIVKGTSATTFGPAANCTRGQLVIMLYRYNKLFNLVPMSYGPVVEVEARVGSLLEA